MLTQHIQRSVAPFLAIQIVCLHRFQGAAAFDGGRNLADGSERRNEFNKRGEGRTTHIGFQFSILNSPYISKSDCVFTSVHVSGNV